MVSDQGPAFSRSTYAVAAWLFRRLLGLVYVFAFGSLSTQITGLIGPNGILPAGVSEVFLTALCGAGVALALLVLLGIAPVIFLPPLWGMYLTSTILAQDFLAYQWDALLLETGFLAVFATPLVIRDRLRSAVEPPRIGRWLLWFLLFRLMFGSGAMKAGSDDPTWQDFTALMFHYETQPIPTPVAWYAHHLPSSFNNVSTAGVFVCELFAPLLIAGPRRLRLTGCALMIALQILIALTGNYAFFNLLAAALCILLVDDAAFARCRFIIDPRGRNAPITPPHSLSPSNRWQPPLLVVVVLVTLPVAVVSFGRSIGVELGSAPVIGAMARLMAPLRSVNTYGLFSVMTTTRPEILVEGSYDSLEWKAYEFRYKPGDVKRSPPWVAPHQPRLDWQMWFAALSSYSSEPWFESFCLRLLEGSPEVLRLLDHNPFQDRPPRYVRATLYQYEFATPIQRREMGIWWRATRQGEYSPIVARALAPR